MKLPIIKTIVSDENLADTDLYAAVRVLETLAEARGLSEEELNVIGELISNIEGAKIVWDDHRHYGTPLKDALNKFMQRVLKSVQ
jgi:hypothetical protein